MLFGAQTTGVFPPRRRGETDGALRKQLNARGWPRDSTILTATELELIRQMIGGDFPSSLAGGAASFLSSTARAHTDASEAKKQQMLAYDAARLRDGVAAKTAEEVEREQARQTDLEKARLKMDETYDEVKAMNRVILEAKCVATREAQRMERRRQKEEDFAYDRRMDTLMNEEAEKAQQMYLERERVRMEEQRRNAAIIKDQLRERDLERVRRLERHQQEQEAMTRHIEVLHQEEHAEKLRRQEAALRLMEEAAIANAEQIELKLKQREMMMDEERKVAEYVKQKEAREEAYAEQQKKIRHEKEMEVARLRAKQERAQDKKAELDELRAKRVQDAYIREELRKEKETAERAAAMQADLQQARLQQIEDKRLEKLQVREMEAEELDRILTVQKISREQELERQARTRRLQEENSLALLKQMMEVEERRRRERQEEIEEGNQLQRQIRERKAALEIIRDRKLEELEQLQVPEKYCKALIRAAK